MPLATACAATVRGLSGPSAWGPSRRCGISRGAPCFGRLLLRRRTRQLPIPGDAGCRGARQGTTIVLTIGTAVSAGTDDPVASVRDEGPGGAETAEGAAGGGDGRTGQGSQLVRRCQFHA